MLCSYALRGRLADPVPIGFPGYVYAVHSWEAADCILLHLATDDRLKNQSEHNLLDLCLSNHLCIFLSLGLLKPVSVQE